MRFLIIVFLLIGIRAQLHAQAPARAVAEAEYFWGSDPGKGAGVSISVEDGAFDEAIESILGSGINAPAAAGPIRFSVRLKETGGFWGPVFTTIVHVQDPAATVSNLRAMNVVQAEYFWNADPGEGNGALILALDGNLDETLESLFSNNVVVPAVGPQLFNLRVRGADGSWSPVFSTIIHGSDPVETVANLRNLEVVQAEYFWNADPGEGNGISMLALDGSLDESLEIAMASASPPAAGIHSLHVRLRGADGVWSGVFSTIVEVKDPAQTVANLREMRIVQAEYFWDSDPGPGNGSPLIALDGDLNETLETAFANGIQTPASVGPHVLQLRMRSADGIWSAPFSVVVHLKAPVDPNADLDGDGIVQLLEEFIGTNPLFPENYADFIQHGFAPLPGGSTEDHFYVEIDRLGFSEELNLDVEFSTDLDTWLGEGDGWVTKTTETAAKLIFFVNHSQQSEPRLFYRLVVKKAN
ncbi:MAG: hypothetical protein AAF585_12255 [Verrucomicrobiota bacterium]